MKKENLAQIVELSRLCLEHYWQGDHDFYLAYFTEDATWIGAQQEQFCHGKGHIAEVFRSIAAEMQTCHLLHQEYQVIHSDKTSCTVMGRYLATTDDTAPYFLQAWQRITMLWTWEADGPKIRHCHVSNPLGELKVVEGETFVNTIGKISNEFLKLRQQAMYCQKRIALTDGRENVHFVSPYEIEHATANRRTTIVFLSGGKQICARIRITDLLEQAGGVLVSVHRSHLVNPFCISRLEKQTIILQSGISLPIPEKRYTEIRETLQGFLSEDLEKKAWSR